MKPHSQKKPQYEIDHKSKGGETENKYARRKQILKNRYGRDQNMLYDA